MKYRSFIFYLAFGFGFYSCTNSTAGNIPATPAKQSSKVIGNDSENQVSFKVNADPVISSGWNISRSLMNNHLVLNVTSNMHEEQRSINVNIIGDKPGRYKFSGIDAYNKPGYAYGSYFSRYDAGRTDPYYFEDGEFVITSIDTAKGVLNAEFSAIVKRGKCEALSITDGRITKGKLRLGIVKY